MAFSIYCLVIGSKDDFQLDKLKPQFDLLFSKTKGFNQVYENLPFNSAKKNLLLTWNDWWIRVRYEDGPLVKEDLVEISKYADSEKLNLISNVTKRVVVRFADDDEKIYTNYIIYMMDFLESKSELLIFNPQNNTFVN